MCRCSHDQLAIASRPTNSEQVTAGSHPNFPNLQACEKAEHSQANDQLCITILMYSNMYDV